MQLMVLQIVVQLLHVLVSEYCYWNLFIKFSVLQHPGENVHKLISF